MRSSRISIREARRMGFNGALVLALAVVLLSFLSVDSFSSNQRHDVRSSSTTVYMAGGHVPLVPYFLGRERWMIRSPNSMSWRTIDIISKQLLSSCEVCQTLPCDFPSSLNHLVHLLLRVACNIPSIVILCRRKEIDLIEHMSIAKLLIFSSVEFVLLLKLKCLRVLVIVILMKIWRLWYKTIGRLW